MGGLLQNARRLFLINALIAEADDYKNIAIPDDEQERRTLLRSLMNLRAPEPISDDVLAVQNAYLKQELAEKGITSIDTLSPVEPGIFLWQGDITTLECDAIVNAANSAMLGCFRPMHNCIDNPMLN